MCYNKASVIARQVYALTIDATLLDGKSIRPSRWRKIRFRPSPLFFQRPSLVRLKTRLIARGKRFPILEILLERNLTSNAFVMNTMTFREHFQLSKPQAIDRYVAARNRDKLPRHLPNPLTPASVRILRCGIEILGVSETGCDQASNATEMQKVSKDLLIIHERFVFYL